MNQALSRFNLRSGWLLAGWLILACQTPSAPLVWEPSCVKNLPSVNPHYYSRESMREFSQAEIQAIESLSPEKLNVETASRGEKQLQNGNFRSILPIQNVDGWNLFVLAELFALSSNFIRSFVLLIEGTHGWQSRYLFPANNEGNYMGGYDIAMYSSDLDYDGRKELVFVSHMGRNGARINVEILQVRQVSKQIRLQIESLEVPRLHSAEAIFLNNFLVRVQLKEENSSTLIRRFPLAREQNLDFDQKGKWIGGNARPWLYREPNRIQTLEGSCNHSSYRLLYTQQPLKGLYHADTIGYFESFWLLRSWNTQKKTSKEDSRRNDRTEQPWILVENNFIPAPGNEVLEYESLLP